MVRPLVEWPPYERAHRALHDLWTVAVGQAGYDKEKWKELEEAIFALGLIGGAAAERASREETL